MGGYPRSKKMYEWARKIAPDGVHSNVRYCEPYPLYFSRAKGCRLWDIDGNCYTDYFLSHGSVLLGHLYPKVVEAVTNQMGKGLTCGVESELTVKVTQQMVDMIPGAEMVRFSTSGTNAVMSAIHIARAYTRKNRIVKFEGDFNGGYDYVRVSYRPKLERAGTENLPIPLVDSAGLAEDVPRNTFVAPLNNIDVMEDILARHKNEIAAVILEPVIFNSGAIHPENGFLESLRELTRDNDVLLIFDEVISGFRMAPGGAQEYFGVVPDLAIYGKAIANGFPLSAVAGKRDMMEMCLSKLRTVSFGGTFNAHHIPLAAATACLEELRRGHVQEYVGSLTQKLIKGFKEVADELELNIHLQGIAGQFSIVFSQEEINTFRDLYRTDSGTGVQFLRFQKEMRKKGIYLCPRHIYHHGISFAHTQRDIEEFLKASADSLRLLKMQGKLP